MAPSYLKKPAKVLLMSSNSAIPSDIIVAKGLGKRYVLFDQPSDRLKELIFGGTHASTPEFWALQNIDLTIKRGEVIGIIGNNGAGKSTLLQLICGTLKPSVGELHVAGRVTALLELGAGFNPDFSGRENIFMNAAILGIDRRAIEKDLDEIIAFADIGAFIDRPVRTYSSGMFMRLAFAVATSSQPDILIIDEALSVGDGAFARKSFDRIMALKDAGATILFCSHAMYQIEALCSRALWIEAGQLVQDGGAAAVTSAYQANLLKPVGKPDEASSHGKSITNYSNVPVQFTEIQAFTELGNGPHLKAISKISTLTIALSFRVDRTLPNPVIALGIDDLSGRTIASASTKIDDFTFGVRPDGMGHVQITFPKLALLKGKYTLTLFLICEQGIHIYDQATRYLSLEVSQNGPEQGVVSLEHLWQA